VGRNCRPNTSWRLNTAQFDLWTSGHFRVGSSSEWDELRGAQKGSMANFAWESEARHDLYRDSERREIVGMGTRRQTSENCLPLDAHSPISSTARVPWCHLIDMDWESRCTFGIMTEIRGLQSQAETGRNQDVRPGAEKEGSGQHGVTEQEETDTLLLEDSYSVTTPPRQN